MSENAIFLIFGILLTIAFFGLVAILCRIFEFFFPHQAERIMTWLNIPTDEEWEEP